MNIYHNINTEKVFFTFILLHILATLTWRNRCHEWHYKTKSKKQSKQKNQTQPPATLTQLKQLRKGRRVQNSEVNHYSYKMKGVWSLGSATIYTCTIITNSQCLPVSKKKKNSALIQIFLLKNSLKSSIFWMQISF